MIELRRLKLNDLKHMHEWMQEKECIYIFQNDFNSMTEKCIANFIKNSFSERNQNFAIVDSKDDIYLGTITLKNINYKNGNAEFAISTRNCAKGTGINQMATNKIIEYGFNILKLDRIYLNVISTNKRAIKFYKKIGFQYEGTFRKHILINGELLDLEWYSVLKEEYSVEREI